MGFLINSFRFGEISNLADVMFASHLANEVYSYKDGVWTKYNVTTIGLTAIIYDNEFISPEYNNATYVGDFIKSSDSANFTIEAGPYNETRWVLDYSSTLNRWINHRPLVDIAYSDDFISWNTAPNPISASFQNGTGWIGGTHNKFVTPSRTGASGSPSTVYTSVDGLNWTLYPMPAGQINVYTGTIHNPNNDRIVFLSLAAPGNAGKGVYTDNLVNYTAISGLPNVKFFDGCWAGGSIQKYIGAGGEGTIVYSTDGINWSSVTPVSSAYYFSNLAYSAKHDKIFAYCTDFKIYESTDAINWSVSTSLPTNRGYVGISIR